jgi:hypothetical protein
MSFIGTAAASRCAMASLRASDSLPWASSSPHGTWAHGSWNISACAGQFVRILVEAADASAASLVEAGVDDVRITRS